MNSFSVIDGLCAIFMFASCFGRENAGMSINKPQRVLTRRANESLSMPEHGN